MHPTGIANSGDMKNSAGVLVLVFCFLAAALQGQHFDNSSINAEAKKWFKKYQMAASAQEKVQFLNKAIEVDPNFTNAYFERARLANAYGDFETAISDSEYLLNQDLKLKIKSTVHLLLADTYLDQGKPEKANEVITKGRAYFQVQTKGILSTMARTYEALASTEKVFIDSALFYYQELQKKGVKKNKVQDQLIALYQLDPKKYANQLAELEFVKCPAKQDVQKRKVCLEEINARSPQFLPVLQELTTLLLKNPGGEEGCALALEKVKNGVKVDPKSMELLLLQTQVAVTCNNGEGAIDAYSRLIKMDPRPEYHMERGFHHFQGSAWSESLKDFGIAAHKLGNQFKFYAQYDQAVFEMLYAGGLKHNKAVLQDYLVQRQQSISALNVAFVQYMLERFSDAEKSLSLWEAKNNGTSNYKYWITKGMICAQLEEEEKSEKALARLMDLKYSSGEIKEAILILKVMGNKKVAKELAEKFDQ